MTKSKVFFIMLAMGISFVTGVQCFAANDSSSASDLSYEEKLFDSSYVHTLNIEVDEGAWQLMAQNATEESYIPCSVTIDGEEIPEVAIRPKGNSSLAATQSSDSDRFSFKIEFDHYHAGTTYYGLDKLALNNLGQDPSCMKDFLAYDMMNFMGVHSPLASYVSITRNGEPFGLYLAVEVVEDAFVMRNYGTDSSGKLYKPDSLNFDDINMSAAFLGDGEHSSMLDALINLSGGSAYADYGAGDRADFLYDLIVPLLEISEISCDAAGLKYLGENSSAYADIFDNAVLPITEEDKTRLITSIRKLNEGTELEDTVDIDQVLRYFAVHSFTMNYDSLASIFAHNYYLYEENGKLSLVPWDYNLAFGSFNAEAVLGQLWDDEAIGYTILPQEYGGMDINTNVINYPIDQPTITIGAEERPIISVLLEQPEYAEQYHQMFDTLVGDYYESGHFEALYAHTFEMLYPYIEQGGTTYTIEQFENGADAIETFCLLRAESIRGQLNGTIPSTLEEQSMHPELLIDSGALDVVNLIDFESMVTAVVGSSLTELGSILDALAPEESDGTVASVLIHMQDIMQDEGIAAMAPVVIDVVSENSFVQALILKTIQPLLYLIVAVVLLMVTLFWLKRYRRYK